MNLAPEIMKEVFEIIEGLYAIRNEIKLKSRKIHSVRYGIETASLLALESGTVYAVTLNFICIYVSICLCATPWHRR